jgi:YihY family inner membrane protein
MTLKDFTLFKSIWRALKEFFREGGVDKSSILAYYSIFSSLFLLTSFTFFFTKFLGDPDIVLKSVYPFSPDFFGKISPDIFTKAEEISMKLKEIGWIGILLTFGMGLLIFRKVIQFVNDMFHIKLRKGFLFRRLREFGLLTVVGVLILASFLMTGFISTMTTLFYKNSFIASHINPYYIESLNNFLVKYLAPYMFTFLVFFIIYKWIPETRVNLKGALISALICALFWEVAKRAYAFFLVNISIFGRIKGPIIAIILFGFWMELSMGIMLYGAKLTHIFRENKKKNGDAEESIGTGLG